MKVVTYATHSEGSFDELVKNPFGVSVVVLGWGTKWNGFMDKFDGIVNYIETLDDNEIVVFIDGFDSYILKPLDDLQKTFESLDCDILVSQEIDCSLSTMCVQYSMNKMYGKCKDSITANSGLYMGRVFALKEMFKLIEYENSSDDQKNLNKVCKKLDRLKIDTNFKIFKNINNAQVKDDEVFKTDAYFLSTPGKFGIKRAVRAVGEHAHVFIPEIILVILLLYLAYLHFVLKK